VRGTAIAGVRIVLPPQQRWNVINYIYSLRGEQLSLPGRPRGCNGVFPATLRRRVNSGVCSTARLDFARKGKSAEAGDRAFDALHRIRAALKTPARAKSRPLHREAMPLCRPSINAVKGDSVGE